MNLPFNPSSGVAITGLLFASAANVLAPSHAEAEGDPPGNATAGIAIRLTPAGHVGADVTLTFPGPEFYAIESWGETRVAGDTILLDARTGSPFSKGGNPPHAPEVMSHLYKLIDVQRIPAGPGAEVSFRTVPFPAGTAPIPEGAIVLRSLREWNDWIAPYDLTAGPLPIAPPVDFDSDILVGVFLGQTPGCHAVEIRRISSQADGTLRVDYTAALPAPGKPFTEGLINPRHVVALAKTAAPVDFHREVTMTPYPATPVTTGRPAYSFLPPEEPMTVVIRSETAWGRFLDRVAGQRDPAFPPPPVDFSKKLLVGVFLGRTPLGRSITIESVTENGAELVVHVQQSTGGAPPPPDEFAYPFDFVSVPQSALPIRFEHSQIALPSPPPFENAREPRDRHADGTTPHGHFQVLFHLNGCELARQEFTYPAVPPPENLVLDALSEPGGTLALDASFEVGITARTIAHWQAPVRHGSNISANVTLSPEPQVPARGISSPAPGSHSNRYVIEALDPGIYRFELRVNDVAAGHVFVRHPAASPATSPFAAWLEALLVRPVWEPVPDAGLLGDLDGDGAGDFLEFALVSDPLDAASIPQWSIRNHAAPGTSPELEITLTRRPGIDCGLATSADLVSWRSLPPDAFETSVERGDDSTEHVTLRWPAPATATEAFVRLIISE